MTMVLIQKKKFVIPTVSGFLMIFSSQCHAADLQEFLSIERISFLELIFIVLFISIFFIIAIKRIVIEQNNRQKAEDTLKVVKERTAKYTKQIDQFTLAAVSMLSIDDESILFKMIADTIVETSDYDRVMISLFKEGEPQREIIGYAGLTAELVAMMSSIPVSTPYFEKLADLADLVGQFSYYIPHTKKHILNQDVVQYGEGPIPDSDEKWHPQDNLNVHMHDENGKLIGVISMDTSKTGLKPVDESVRPIEIFSSLIAQLILIKRSQQKQQHLQFQLDQFSRSEAFSKIAETVAADLNDSLGVVLGNTDLALLNTEPDSPAHDNLKVIRQAGNLARQHTQRLSAYSKKEDLQISGFNIVPTLEETISLTRVNLPTTIELHLNIQTNEALVRTGPSQMGQVIHNLCTNSIEAMSLHGGTLSVSLNIIRIKSESTGVPGDLAYGKYARIIVSDTGPGIEPSILPQIFDPSFTTKPAHSNKGMGLTQARNLIEGCGGRITVNSTPDFGASFTLYLPLFTEPVQQIEKTDESTALSVKHVLFVDDDQSIISLAQVIFEQLGYTVETSTNPVEALNVFNKNPQQFDLIVTDMTMPDMKGDELAVKILSIRPDVPIILSTGYSDLISKEEALKLGIRGYYEKPLTFQPFSRTLHEVMEQA